MYEPVQIAKMIKKTAKDRGILLKDIFNALELNKNALTNMYQGSTMKSDSLARIADCLGCSVDYLLGRTDNPEVNWFTPGGEKAVRVKEIYLAGGCYWGVEKYVSGIPGVLETEVGFANGNTDAPTYQQVRHENTGHAETVHVRYDANVLPPAALLKLFYKIIDPTSVDKQGEDVGHQYRTGVYYTAEEDAPIIRVSLAMLEKEAGAPIAVECRPLEQFWRAEEYHQKYLDKNPGGYCHVPLELIQWVKTIDPTAGTTRGE